MAYGSDITEGIPYVLSNPAGTAAAEALANLKASAKAKLIAGKPLTSKEADTLIL